MIYCILNTNSTIVLAPVVIYISLRHAVPTFQIFLSLCLIYFVVARTVMTIKNNYGYILLTLQMYLVQWSNNYLYSINNTIIVIIIIIILIIITTLERLKRLKQLFCLPHGVALSRQLTAHAQIRTPLTIWRSVARTEAAEQKITHTKEDKVPNKPMIQSTNREIFVYWAPTIWNHGIYSGLVDKVELFSGRGRMFVQVRL